MDAEFATVSMIQLNFKVETISCADDMASPSLKIPRARGAWPLLGHALSFRRDPIRFFRKHGQGRGPVYFFQLFQRKIIVANDPEAVEAILIGEVQQFSRKKTYAFLEALLGNGLITSEGAHWRKNRRMMQPGFKREQLVGLMGGIQESVSNWCQRIEQGGQNAQCVDLHHAMNALTLEVLTGSIIETGWSGELDSLLGLRGAFHLEPSRVEMQWRSIESGYGSTLPRCWDGCSGRCTSRGDQHSVPRRVAHSSVSRKPLQSPRGRLWNAPS